MVQSRPGVQRLHLSTRDRLEERLALLQARIDLRQPLVCPPLCLGLYRHERSLGALLRLFDALAAMPPAAAARTVAPAIASFRPSFSKRITCHPSCRAISSRGP